MVRTTLALLIGLVITISCIGLEEANFQNLQRYYFQTYVASRLYEKHNYRFLYVLYGNRWQIAHNEDVERQSISVTGSGAGFPFVLSKQALLRGAKRLEWRELVDVNGTAPRKYLQDEIFDGRTPFQLIASSIVFGSLCMAGIIGLLLWRKRTAVASAMNGAIIRGPHVVSSSEFNCLKKSDGIGFEVIDAAGAVRRFITGNRRRTVVRVRADEETSHFLLIGDSGTGKSSLIRQLLTQIRERRESAIVYDPATDFTPQFYDPVSDVILNPVDKRMPFWTPSDEVRNPVDAAALATSLFPDKLGDKNFFTDSAQKIFAHLLRYHPTPQELIHWMKNADELDKRVAGTEFEAMIRKSAVAQRAAVQGTLNQAAAAFNLLPAEEETKTRWSAAKWVNETNGCIFLPSLPAFRQSLRPLTSMWLDALIMRLMDSAREPASRVWLILDELSSLQRLPQLPAAVTESRKSNICLVLGFQGRSQLEAIYGQQSEAMLSQPMTKIFLRTSEPNAAQWVSRSIGEVELLRREEAHTWNFRTLGGFQRGTTSQLRRYTEPLVLPSTIASLPNLTGYVKSKDLVFPAVFNYMELKKRHPGFEPRALRGLEPLVLEESIIPELRTAGGRSKRTGTRTRKKDQNSSSQIKIFD